MRLQNLLSLTGALLKTEPAVTQFGDIVLELRRVRRGDLFIALDNAQIDAAIERGAYAVLYAGNAPVTDPEIAWLNVDNIDTALTRILRFHLLDKLLNVITTDVMTLSMAACMLHDARCHVLHGSIQNNFNAMWSLQNGDWVFIPDEKVYADLFVSTQSLRSHVNAVPKVVANTLFETSFILDGTYYSRVALPPLFLTAVARLYSFAKENALLIHITGVQDSGHFEPIFTTLQLQIKPHGQGEKALIFESELALMQEEIAYMQAKARWAECLFFMPNHARSTYRFSVPVHHYDGAQDIIEVLSSTPFHFALIGGASRAMLDMLQPTPSAHSLF